MRNILIVTGLCIFLAGCCPFKKYIPPQKSDTTEQPVAVQVVPQVPSLPPVVPVIPPAVPKDTGKANQKEVAIATAGKDIPQTSPAPGKKFVAPVGEVAQFFMPVYFDFDDYSVKSEYQTGLRKAADYLLSHPGMDLLIEGYCDDRGTEEYNLVLGEQRALSVRRYLVGLGISPKRLFTVSYGEENPADSGQNEAAWAKNRRAEFKVSQD